MIFVITILTTLAFIYGAIFIGFTPNTRYLVEKDFLKRATQNAELAGLQYGDLCLRTHTIMPPSKGSKIPSTKKIIGALNKTDSNIQSCIKTTITAQVGPEIKVEVTKVAPVSNQCP